MREIKFRAYNKSLKQMFPVKYLSDWYAWGDDADFLGKARMENTAHDYSPKDGNTVVMQFTGLKASNGDIYENDIVALPKSDLKWQVVYDRWGIPALCRTDYPMGMDFKQLELEFKHTPTRVILLGNIFENQDLLK